MFHSIVHILKEMRAATVLHKQLQWAMVAEYSGLSLIDVRKANFGEPI